MVLDQPLTKQQYLQVFPSQTGDSTSYRSNPIGGSNVASNANQEDIGEFEEYVDFGNFGENDEPDDTTGSLGLHLSEGESFFQPDEEDSDNCDGEAIVEPMQTDEQDPRPYRIITTQFAMIILGIVRFWNPGMTKVLLVQNLS